jgi:hypothetical protein
MSAKESVLQAIHRLPDDADYRAIAEEVAFLAALERGDHDIQAGRVVSNEDVRKNHMWFESGMRPETRSISHDGWSTIPIRDGVRI